MLIIIRINILQILNFTLIQHILIICFDGSNIFNNRDKETTCTILIIFSLQAFCATLKKIQFSKHFTEYTFLLCQHLVSVLVHQSRAGFVQQECDTSTPCTQMNLIFCCGSVLLNPESSSVLDLEERFFHSSDIKQSVTSSPAGVMG